MDYARATTVPSVRKYDICAIPFPLPPYAEQIRISAKLIELVNRSNDSSGLIQQCDIQSKLLWQSILLSSFSGNNRK
jgi:type I restriction enzyme S subunit